METKYKNLTAPDYGIPKSKQHHLIQELTRPHIESFNYLIHEGLTEIVSTIVPQEFALPNGDKVALNFQEVIIGRPLVSDKAVSPRTLQIYPAECRGRGVTYSGPLRVQIGFSVNSHHGPPITKDLGQVPIMVKSDVCNLARLSPKELIKHGEEAEEMGGYFIVNGIERLIRQLIMPRRNFPTCVTRPSWKNRGSMYTEFGISMRCVRSDQCGSFNVLHYLNNGTAVLNFNHQKEMFFVPVIIILKGLVSVSDKFIYDELVKGKEDDSFYKGCVVNMLRQALSDGLTTKSSVLRYIGKRFRIKLDRPDWYTDEQIGTFLFKECICVHLSSDVDKFNILVYMTKKLFEFAKGKCAPEGSDNPMNQEVLLGGHLYLMVLKEKLEGYLLSLKRAIQKHAKDYKAGSDRYRLTPDSLMMATKFGMNIAKMMSYLLATGNLVSTSGLGLMQASGLTVVADKLNFLRYVSHFRCIHRGAFFTKMRTTSVRKLLPEAWGIETFHSCLGPGIPVPGPHPRRHTLWVDEPHDCTVSGEFRQPMVKVTIDKESMASLSQPASHSGSQWPFQIQTATFQLSALVRLLYTIGVCPLASPPGPVKDCYTVLMDGRIMGYVTDDMAVTVENKLRYLKVKGLQKVPPMIEICLVRKTQFASQYPGLYLFTGPARMLRPVINLSLQLVEMIGTFEQVYMNICITLDEAHDGITSHQEMNEVSMLSFVANLTPFSDFNQSPRNMYQCQMGKQTMGTPLHALRYRSDNKLYKLQTPQAPLVRPIKYDQYDIDNYPLGTNAVVAVISYTGYDMEDAMVINKASFERGFGHATVYKSEMIDLGSVSGQRSTSVPLLFGCQASDKNVVSGKLDVDGLPPIGTYLENGSPYYSYTNLQTGEQKLVTYKSMEAAYVEHIRAAGNDTGTSPLQRVSIMLRVNRNPIIGDKFASRHGQKGVCSMMYPVENMPFTESGMTPDIIFNPHGYPSRMTIGMMIESMAGKSAASFADCYDATPFKFSEDDSAIDYFGKMLVAAGYNYYGTERFYSGVDGRELEANIFMGVVYYQRLRHMVSDKFQVRTTGPIDQLTHQPIKGRKRHGGVRFGEMERDALISHGTSFLLQDRLFNCSDKSMAHVCTQCGSLLSALIEKPAQATAAASFESQRRWSCVLCKREDKIQVIAVPYVFRYLVAELAAMNIKVDLTVK